MAAKATGLSCTFEDALSEDSTHCPFSTHRSNSSIAGTADREDEADCGSSVKELFTITESDYPPPSFASFYSDFLRSDAIQSNEITQCSSSTPRMKLPPAPEMPVAQLAFLDDLIKGFERLEIQIELQRMLIFSKVCQESPRAETAMLAAMSRMVEERIEIELSVYQEIMRKHGFTQKRGPFMGKIPVWEFIAPFSDHIGVSNRLSKIDELLALPVNSTLEEVQAWEHGKN